MMRHFLLWSMLVLIGACSHAIRTETVQINTANGPVRFEAKIADSPRLRNKGLMHQRKLDEHNAMLFKFKRSEKVSMWMKNTYIPLDMLFIDQHGVIRFIHKQAKTESTASITSPVDVIAVLEINAGLSEELGIAIGDQVIYLEVNE